MFRTAILLGPALFPGPQDGIRLVGEAADGTTRELALGTLAIEDPRELGVVLLRFEGVESQAGPVPETTDAAELVLAGGDRIQGRVGGGEGEELFLRLIGEVSLPVNVAEFQSLIFPARIPERRAAPVEAPRELDRLYHRTGSSLDTVDGTVESFSAEGVVFDSNRVGTRTYPWGEIAALFVEVLGPDGEGAAGEGAPVVCDLVDGSRVRGRMQKLSSDGLALVVGANTAVDLPLSTIAEIALDDGSIAFLSDLPVAREEGKGNPFPGAASGDDVIGMLWPHRRDRACTGGPLRAGGRTYRRGLGAHAPSRLTWNLDGTWRELRGKVALDDSVLPERAEGSVVFRIWVDGEKVWESPVMRGGDPPVPFPGIALKGKEELVLQADMATDLHAGDRADWLRMLLVK